MAKKKKRKPAPPPRPVTKKKPSRQAAPATAVKRKQPARGQDAEKLFAGWSQRAGIAAYSTTDWGRLAVLAIGFCVIVLYAFSAGGYFVVRRGYGELMVLWLLVVGLLFELQMRGRMSRRGMLQIGLFAGYVAWIMLSITWSLTPARSIDEFVRGLLYLSGFGLFYLYMSRREWLGWLGHLFIAIVAIVAIDALLGKTFPNLIDHPDPFMSNRINYPLTYWNTMALFVSMGFIIGLRVLADRMTHVALRVVYAPVMFLFLVVLWFTYSRAGLLLLAAAICLYMYLSLSRLRVVLQAGMVSLWAALVVAISYAGLPNMVASVPDQTLKVTEGHKLALALVVFMVVAVISQVVLRRLEDRITISRQVGRRIGQVLAGGVALLLVSAVLVFTFTGGRGGPVTFVRNQVGGFNESERAAAIDAPTERLFSLKSERFQEYSVSLKRLRDDPLLGSGAGTWSLAWLQYRPWDIQVKDGHSWFFESLAELGVVGGALLVAFLSMFFVISIRDLRFLGRTRERELYGAFFVACTAFLIHAMVDWDWEMPVISLAFFMFAGAMLRYGMLARVEAGVDVGGQEEGKTSASRLPRPLRWNWLLGYGCVLAMVCTILPLIATSRVQSANLKAQQKDYAGLEADAQLAGRLDPLDAEPVVLQALARQGLHDIDGAVVLLEKARDMEPENDKTYRNLVRVYLVQYKIAKKKGDRVAMQDIADKATAAIIKSRILNPLESKETGDLEIQVRLLGGYVPPPPGIEQ
ncbi:MAG: O-antigen ligase family protein [Thermoleophilia bacterium]